MSPREHAKKVMADYYTLSRHLLRRRLQLEDLIAAAITRAVFEATDARDIEKKLEASRELFHKIAKGTK